MDIKASYRRLIERQVTYSFTYEAPGFPGMWVEIGRHSVLNCWGYRSRFSNDWIFSRNGIFFRSSLEVILHLFGYYMTGRGTLRYRR